MQQKCSAGQQRIKPAAPAHDVRERLGAVEQQIAHEHGSNDRNEREQRAAGGSVLHSQPDHHADVKEPVAQNGVGYRDWECP